MLVYVFTLIIKKAFCQDIKETHGIIKRHINRIQKSKIKAKNKLKHNSKRRTGITQSGYSMNK